MVDLVEDSNERVLSDFFGVLSGADRLEAKAVYEAFVAFHELSVGLDVVGELAFA